MSDIDWSKAPEGATHFAPKREDSDMWCAVFWRLENAVGVEAWQVCNDTGQLHHVRWPTWLPETASRLIARPSAWTGEGLPPVGAVCEVFNQELHAAAWERCEILFAGRHRVVYDSESCSERVGDVEYLKFRPIRTPEQIAAEEREKAIDGMFNEANERAFMSHRELCAALYDAGYRKTEAP